MLTLPLCGPYALAACLGACRIAPSPGDRWASGLGELADVALHLPAAASQLSLPHQTTLALVTVLGYG